jgi:hypothetical protein
MFCNSYTRVSSVLGVFVSISDVCCKCFNGFRDMLQVFHLNVPKGDLMCTCCNVTHLSQPSTAAAGHRACIWKVGG